jgi:isopenicillin N synthase-like dioxygenase
MTLMTVPIIDIAPYRTGAEVRKRAVAQKIDEACRDIGFLVIAGHGVSADLIQAGVGGQVLHYDVPTICSPSGKTV